MAISLPDVDLSENRQPNLYASSTVPWILALICIALRFWCRLTRRIGLWLDDWLILVAGAFATGLTAALLWWIPRGLGRHIQAFGPNATHDLLLADFVCELTYTGVIVFVKFSILALYWRIFVQSTSIKLPIMILGTLVSMWGLAVFLLTVLQCIPTRGVWDKGIDASCNVDSQKFLFAISIPNILIDAALLALPIPYVVKLRLDVSQKTAILSMFLLGSFVFIASILRLVSVLRQKNDADVTWNLIDQAIWATTEADLAIISACLPTLRPVYLALRPKRPGKDRQQPPAPQSDMPATIGSGRPNKKRILSSWTSSLLKMTVADDEEDTQPFSVAKAAAPLQEDLRHGLVPRSREGVGYAEVVPLSNLGKPGTPGGPGRGMAIGVDSEWQVQYSERARPGIQVGGEKRA